MKVRRHFSSDVTLHFWTPHFLLLDSTLFRLDSTFWLDSTLKLNSVRAFTRRAVGVNAATTTNDDDETKTTTTILVYYYIHHRCTN